ncbi:MAG: hypothetical protein ACYDDF_15355 [Thermoplasmatota archaeon]
MSSLVRASGWMVAFLFVAGAASAGPLMPGVSPLHANASGTPPSSGTATLYLNLSGVGSLPRNNTGDTFQVTVNVSGPVSLSGNNGQGNGGGFRGTSLSAMVAITYKDANGTIHTAETFTTTVDIHAESSSFAAQGVQGFRFNLNTHGRAGPILAFGLHGNATGSARGNDAVVATGHANVKKQQGADNYLLATSGTAQLRP